jgi:hypothetical protein
MGLLPRYLCAPLLLAGLLVRSSPSLAALTTDVIRLDVGDQVTGEVVRLSNGQLSVKTNQMGTVSLEWPHVVSLTSPRHFVLELQDGRRLTGSLGAGATGLLRVEVSAGAPVEVPLGSVVEMTPLGAGFWSRLTGSMSAGFSYTASSKVSQFSFSGNVNHRTEKTALKLSFDTIVVNQGEKATHTSTSRYDGLIGFDRYLSRKWFWSGIVQAQSNDELGIDLRVLVSGLAGRTFVKTTHSLAQVGLGLTFNEELEAGSDKSAQNLEALLSGQYSYFFYDAPETRLTSKVSLYQGITQSDRFRADVSLSLRRELFRNFFSDLSAFYAYDSKAPPDGMTRSDWGTVLSLGWSF